MSETILPHELPHALDRRRGIRVLSLDCFDTLIWRDTHAPHDIFRLLPGITPQQRIWAEQRARRGAMVRHGRNEVTLAEIHAELFPNGDAAQHAALTAAELDTEARHCFAFAPTVALIREAKRRGLTVAIVSDTYLTRDQLAELIRRAAGDEVAAMIDRIFVSSEHGRSKAEGLFAPMLRAMRIRPEQVLHIGDNAKADAEAPRRHRIHALHLLQFDEANAQRLRLEAATDAILHAGGVPFQPHRAALAAGQPVTKNAAEALGHGVLGPVLAPFARWIADEAASLRGDGRLHLLFLMRDGYLPRRVHAALFPETETHAIEISRFTAFAASLTDEAAIRRYVEAELGNGEPEDLLRQLLFTPEERAAIVAALPSRNPLAALAKAVLSADRLAMIAERSRAFADRLTAYLQSEVAPQPEDTLMLIDLGYNGTVQNRLETTLRERLGTRIAGRYLLLREQEATGLDKRGFLDARNYDSATLEAFAGAVAVLEQLCTAAQGSVIDYVGGAAHRAAPSVSARQNATREAVQQGALAFAVEQHTATVRTQGGAAAAGTLLEAGRRSAAAALARLMFLPLPGELAVLEAFEHDINLGGDEMVALFDPAVAARGLRERGLFYLKGADRMYLPAELRGHGLPLNLTLLAQRRFGLDLRFTDFCDSGIEVPILLADGRDVAQSGIRATPTHEGYYLAAIPVGAGRFAVGIQFGRLYEWLQIQSAEFMPVRAFLAERSAARSRPIEALPSLEGMEQVAPHLFHCGDPGAFLMVPPPAEGQDEPMMLAVTFRPLVERASVAAPAAHAAGAQA